MKAVRTDQLARLLIDAEADGVSALPWRDWVAQGAAIAKVSPATLDPAARMMARLGYVVRRGAFVSLSALGRARLAAFDRQQSLAAEATRD